MSLSNPIIRQIEKWNSSELTDEEIQRLITASIRLYVKALEEQRVFFPFTNESDLSATDVLITITKMMRQANLEAFELGLWQTFHQ